MSTVSDFSEGKTVIRYGHLCKPIIGLVVVKTNTYSPGHGAVLFHAQCTKVPAAISWTGTNEHGQVKCWTVFN